MSDHFDAADHRTDLTDLYVFPAADRGRVVIVLCFNPEPDADELPFDPEASYEVKLNTDNDAVADVAFNVVFSHVNGRAAASVYRAVRDDATGAGAAGAVIVANAPLS